MHDTFCFNLQKNKKYSAVYLLGQILTFRGSSGIDGINEIKAKFVLSEVNKLAVEARAGSLFLLFFTTGMHMVMQSNYHACVCARARACLCLCARACACLCLCVCVCVVLLNSYF